VKTKKCRHWVGISELYNPFMGTFRVIKHGVGELTNDEYNRLHIRFEYCPKCGKKINFKGKKYG